MKGRSKCHLDVNEPVIKKALENEFEHVAREFNYHKSGFYLHILELGIIAYRKERERAEKESISKSNNYKVVLFGNIKRDGK
jgi:hypothetical protein